jgi:LPS export ABC transporter protein LptC|tara:strand:- start:547 stop:1149 length:603 start_codon:yes stop_codon:yes gene_type:complete
MERKKKLRFLQLFLLIAATLIIVFTYSKRDNELQDKIISKETEKKIQKQIASQSEDGDIFFNIEYTGLDLAGNRYILKSEEAFSKKSNQEIVELKTVEAAFYFKDNTVLKIYSNTGKYNNKTLDMSFFGDVKALYEDSRLFAQKAEYSNSKSYLEISEKVKINDTKGTMVADKLFFDIKKQTLNIASFEDKKVNTNIVVK